MKITNKQIDAMNEEQRTYLFKNMMLGLPGSDDSFTPGQVLAELEKYKGITAAKLKENLYFFLREVVPVAEECGVKLAIHPDDPPLLVDEI